MLSRQDIKVFLELLDELCVGAEHSETDSDDYSGCNTKYTLDSEQFRKNVQKKLQNLEQRMALNDREDGGNYNPED